MKNDLIDQLTDLSVKLQIPLLKADDPITPIYLFFGSDELNGMNDIYLKNCGTDTSNKCFLIVNDKSYLNNLIVFMEYQSKSVKDKYLFIIIAQNDLKESFKLQNEFKAEADKLDLNYFIDSYLLENNFFILSKALNSADTEAKAEAVEHYKRLIEKGLETVENDYLINNCVYNALDDFRNNLSNSESLKMYSTGFNNLDYLLNGGIMKGLITIGASTGLGKTTFVLQLCDQIAQRRRADILYFSLEMSKKELIAKSISRITKIKEHEENKKGLKKDLSTDTIGIIQAKKYNEFSAEKKAFIKDSFADYGSYSNKLFIFESNPRARFTVEDIEKIILKHKQKTGNKDIIVVIDYLQILKSTDPRLSDKQFIDNSITTLKGIATEQNITVIAISSLNRQSYGQEIDLSSLKESGSIEYTSDIVLALDYTIYKETSPKGHRYAEICAKKGNGEIGKIDEDKKVRLINESIEADKEKGFKRISLTILKHRYGENLIYTNFYFWQAYNLFTECKENKANFEDLAEMLKDSVIKEREELEEISPNLPF